LIEIIKENIDIEEYSEKSQKLYKEILQQSSKFEEFTRLTHSKLKPDLDALRDAKISIIECPECFHKTLPIDGSYKCLFCGNSDYPEDLAYNYIENILRISKYSTEKDGGNFPLENCPGCDQGTLVLIDDSYLCFTCGESWKEDELAFCNYCNGVYISKEGDLGMCDDCRQAKSNSFMES
jgi:ssDNA-binding Zn-finger/Zn-ribbon topoisomerase 1